MAIAKLFALNANTVDSITGGKDIKTQNCYDL